MIVCVCCMLCRHKEQVINPFIPSEMQWHKTFRSTAKHTHARASTKRGNFSAVVCVRAPCIFGHECIFSWIYLNVALTLRITWCWGWPSEGRNEVGECGIFTRSSATGDGTKTWHHTTPIPKKHIIFSLALNFPAFCVNNSGLSTSHAHVFNTIDVYITAN